MTRKMAYIGISYFIGLFFASFISFDLSICLGIIFLITALSAIFLKIKKSTYILLCLSVVSLSMIWYGVYEKYVYNDIVSVADKSVELTGVISERSDFSDDNSSYILDTKINNHNAKVIVYAETIFDIGDKVTIEGVPYLPENNYLFPQKDYYRTNGIFLCINAEKYNKITHLITPNSVASLYRNYLSSEIDYLAPGREGKLMKALIFGDKSGMDDEVVGYFSKSGISHIISVSGFHLAVVCGIVFYLLKTMKLGKIPRFIISEIFIFSFAALAGFSFSVVRSGIMMTVFLLGDLIKRRQDILSSLGTALILLTITMPFAIRNTSLLLSVTGVFGIGVVAPYFTKGINFGKYIDKPLKILIYSAVCSLTTLPFVLLTFREVSVISPISNLLLVPLCSVILILGIIVVLTMGIKMISSPLIIFGGIVSKLVIFITELLSSISFSTVSFEYDVIVVVVFVLFAIVSLSVFIFKSRKFALMTIMISVSFIIISHLCIDILSKDNISVTVFTGKYSSVVIEKSDIITVIGKDGKKQEDAVYRYLSNKGKKEIDTLVITSNSQYYIASYDDVFYDIDVGNVLISDKSGIPDMTVMGCNPETYKDKLVLEYDDYIITVDNDNIYIDYKDFSMLCIEKSEFENKDYSVVFFEKHPEFISSGYLLEDSETKYGYEIISDGDKVKVVEL
ncbi:MAG: ComEC/Rec2 family competence protein [Oscillospiraceae bacterium]|nr:ComEC/Rec2 family competence protein [Oscillospiraceae bacterium]